MVVGRLRSGRSGGGAGYVLEYELNDNPLLRKVSRAIARRNGWHVIRLETFPKLRPSTTRIVNQPDVSEWLSLFRHASFVVTDSFHGTAFSLNLNRPFHVVQPPKYTSRLSSILKLTGTESRVVSDLSALSREAVDFATVNAALDLERRRATNFLRSAIFGAPERI